MLVTEFLAARVKDQEQPGMGFARIYSSLCESVTLILREHNTWAALYPSSPLGSPSDCLGCGFNAMEDRNCENVNECPVLRALAWVWRDRPDWDPIWKPEGV